MTTLAVAHRPRPPDHPPLQRTACGRLIPRGDHGGTIPHSAQGSPEVSLHTPSRPDPGVIAAAGHRAVRNRTLAQTATSVLQVAAFALPRACES
jgi:hypothetical protein